MAEKSFPESNKEYLGCVCIPGDIVALFEAHPVTSLELRLDDGECYIEKEHIALCGRDNLWFSKNPERSWQFPGDAPGFAYWQCETDSGTLFFPKEWVRLSVLREDDRRALCATVD